MKAQWRYYVSDVMSCCTLMYSFLLRNPSLLLEYMQISHITWTSFELEQKPSYQSCLKIAFSLHFELNSFSNAIMRGGAKNIWMFSYGSDSQCPAPLIVMQFKLHSIGPWQLVKFVHFKKKKKNVTTFRNQKKKELNSYVCLKRPGLCNLTYI